MTENEFSTPIAKAERLTRLRNLANLSRPEICSRIGFSIDTYKSWETGRFGGLSVSGAEKIIGCIAKEGVVCSIEWLLHGRQQGPYVLPNIVQNNHSLDVTSIEIILKEISLLHSYYHDLIFIEVSDDGMAPEYVVGNFVAGRKKYSKDIEQLVNKNCIIQTKDGRNLIRNLRFASKKNLYNLLCTNFNSSVLKPIEYEIEIEFAAEIIRRYNKST